MNIDGLSEATLEKFIGSGFLHEFADIFKLKQHRESITQMEGFGEKSCRNLLDSIEKARKTTLPKLLFSLGIANIGLANAKVICKECQYEMDKMLAADVEELSQIDGVGAVIAQAFVSYFNNEANRKQLEHLLNELEIEKETVEEGSQTLAGKSFVITGSLEQFENRNELKALIEKKGGKVTGSVTGKTECLINNDSASNSSKNKKAKELGVRIVTEAEFLEEYMS